MSKDPAFLFYPGDFLIGCSDLTMEERGQYITLLCLEHQKGRLTEKTIRLTVGSVSVDVLKKFAKDENGNIFNERLEIEIEKRMKFVVSRRENGKLGGRPLKPTGKLKKTDRLLVGSVKDNLPIIENEDVNKDISNKEKKEIFESARKMFPGKKRGLDTEYDNFKKHKDWQIVLDSLLPAIIYQCKWRSHSGAIDNFIPEWKNFKTWINQRDWEMDMGAIPAFKVVKTTIKMCVECGGTNEEPPTVNPRNDVCPICTAKEPDDYFLMHDFRTAMEIINEVGE